MNLTIDIDQSIYHPKWSLPNGERCRICGKFMKKIPAASPKEQDEWQCVDSSYNDEYMMYEHD